MRTVPPCGASTRAAALASRSAKSTVMGGVPTWPRMPSVPKKRRVIGPPPGLTARRGACAPAATQCRRLVLAGGSAERRGALLVGHAAALHDLAGLGRLVPIGGRARIAPVHDVLDLLLV